MEGAAWRGHPSWEEQEEVEEEEEEEEEGREVAVASGLWPVGL
jgi:hypothetical protein